MLVVCASGCLCVCNGLYHTVPYQTAHSWPPSPSNVCGTETHDAVSLSHATAQRGPLCSRATMWIRTQPARAHGLGHWQIEAVS